MISAYNDCGEATKSLAKGQSKEDVDRRFFVDWLLSRIKGIIEVNGIKVGKNMDRKCDWCG